MERKIISKTNDTSKLASRDRELQDSELASVSGGLVVNSIIAVLIDPLPLTIRSPRRSTGSMAGDFSGLDGERLSTR